MVMAWAPMVKCSQFHGNWSTGSKVWNGGGHMNAHAQPRVQACTHTHTERKRVHGDFLLSFQGRESNKQDIYSQKDKN
jgi:hypothetical protein